MIRSIVESSQRLRFLVVVIAAMMVFFGVTQLRNMPVDVLPEFEPPMVEVQTEAPGLSAAEVAGMVTLDVEELLSGTSWLQSLHSRSVPGLSSILMVFEPGTSLMHARQLVQERLTMAFMLPNVSKAPAILQPVSATSRVMTIGLTSKEVSPIQMSVLARWTIKPRLMGVPGVANVAIWGQRDWQLQVLIDQEQLRTHGVSQEQIISTTGDAMWVSPLTFLNASHPGTGGWIDTPNQRLGVQHLLPIASPENLARVPVDNAALRLGDVAKVVEGHPPLIGDALVNGTPGLLFVIEKLPGANTLAVTRGVEAALAAMRTGLPGIEIDAQIFRAATFIETAFANLTRVLLISAVLMVLVLGAFLYNWRSGVISCVAMPLSLLAATLVLYWRGATINMMMLAGFVIALGAVVDDAIIDIENVVRRLRQQRQEGSDRSPASIMLEAVLEVRGAIVYATLIAVLAVLPVFFMGGLAGAFFQPLAVSYALALLASMVVALTVTPALSLLLLRHAPLEHRESPLVQGLQRLQRGAEAVLARIIRTPSLAYVAVGVLVLVGLMVWSQLGQELLPSFRERTLLIDMETTPGTSQPAMSRMAGQVSRELQSIRGVRHVGAQVGRAVTGDQVVGMNAGQLWVTLDPTADYDQTVAKIQETAHGYPGLDGKVQTYLTERLRVALTGTSEAITVRIFGNEQDTLRDLAQGMEQVLARIDGLVDVQVEGQIEEPQVEIKVNLTAAEKHGLKPGDIRRQTATIFAGLGVGTLFEAQKMFDVVVWGAPEARQSLTNLHNFLLETPGNSRVRLGEVAEVRIAPTPTVIKRDAISRRIDVVANVRGRDLGSVSREVTQRLQDVKFPLEYHAELLGEYAERQATQKRIFDIAVAAALGIFLLLQAAFRSWRLAFVAFITLPLALVGGVLAAFAGGSILSLGSLIGFLALLGVAARHGIVLITHYQHLAQHEGETFGPGLVLRGTRERFAPILMTATTIGVALVPLVLFGNMAGNEIVHPMAVVILGGLVTSTLLYLFIVPALYLHFGFSPEPDTSSLS
jgi:CzcA family heavy metal efflux pump